MSISLNDLEGQWYWARNAGLNNETDDIDKLLTEIRETVSFINGSKHDALYARAGAGYLIRVAAILEAKRKSEQAREVRSS